MLYNRQNFTAITIIKTSDSYKTKILIKKFMFKLKYQRFWNDPSYDPHQP